MPAAELRQVKKGRGLSWLLIPGGPGLHSNYLEALFEKFNPAGSVWTFNLPEKPPAQFSPENDAAIVRSWRKELVRAVTRLDQPCLFGHSFGGMLALSCSELASMFVAAVFASATPSSDWEKAAQEASAEIPAPGLPEALAAFEQDPNEETSRGAYLTWAPLYAVDVEACKKLFHESRFIEWPLRMVLRGALAGHQSSWREWSFPTLCISGNKDRITPGHLFSNHSLFKDKPNVEIEEIPGAGHFPWVERETEYIDRLRHFERSLRSPRRPVQQPLLEGTDYTIDALGRYVFTRDYFLRRGYCCENGCANCPYGFRKL